jgi:cytoskeletal protein RodZ
MNTFSTELKQEREARKITLLEISKKTRINIKFLEALEQGAFDVLPQTYIRAFIKGYAEAVGLSVDDLLRKYDVHVGQQFTESTPGQDVPHFTLHTDEAVKALNLENKKRAMVFMGAGAVLLLFILVYVFTYMNSADNTRHVKETPFQDVVHEQERTKNSSTPADSSAAVKPAAAPLSDSLTLRMVAIDSVWISVTRDSLPPRQGYLLNGTTRIYTAKNQFKISLGNAGGIKLYLNGTELPSLGLKGHSTRNVIINADYLKQQ